eukprot:Lithocolla_globosa_v1_NODE_1499_length_2530_cov_27.157980.p2 type:complete len:103 gc:universal NODE_1499_length_2530_cov_27.157980:1476-1784(+)
MSLTRSGIVILQGVRYLMVRFIIIYVGIHITGHTIHSDQFRHVLNVTKSEHLYSRKIWIHTAQIFANHSKQLPSIVKLTMTMKRKMTKRMITQLMIPEIITY